jgi:hypothetical protein
MDDREGPPIKLAPEELFDLSGRVALVTGEAGVWGGPWSAAWHELGPMW